MTLSDIFTTSVDADNYDDGRSDFVTHEHLRLRLNGISLDSRVPLKKRQNAGFILSIANKNSSFQLISCGCVGEDNS